MNIELIVISAIVTVLVAAALTAVSHMADRARYAFSDGSFGATAAKFGRGF